LRCRYGNFDGNFDGGFDGGFHGDFYCDFYGDFALAQTQQTCQYNLATTTLPMQHRHSTRTSNATARATESNRTPLQEPPKAPLRTEPQ